MLVSNSIHPSMQLADKLYQLQKQYIKDRLLGENAQHMRQLFLQQLFQAADQMTLRQIIDLEQLTGVVQEQVFKVNLAPPMLSMIGEMTQNIHEQLRQTHTPLSSFVSEQQVEHWLRKALEMEHLFDYIQQKIKHTPQIQALCAYWINQNIERYTPEQFSLVADKATARLPRRIQIFLQEQQQKFEEKLEEKTAQLFQQQLLFLFSLPSEEYLTLGLSIWDSFKDKPIAEFAAQGSPVDSEEVFIFIYEFWKDLRQNPNVQQIIRSGIGQFYHAFADESLYYLFQSTGLKVENIQTEAERFVPAILQRLEQLGKLEQLLDNILQPFFQQAATLAAIEEHLA